MLLTFADRKTMNTLKKINSIMFSSDFNGKRFSRSLPNVPERFKSCWNLGVRCSASKKQMITIALAPSFASHYSMLLSWHHNTTVAVTSHIISGPEIDMNISAAGRVSFHILHLDLSHYTETFTIYSRCNRLLHHINKSPVTSCEGQYPLRPYNNKLLTEAKRDYLVIIQQAKTSFEQKMCAASLSEVANTRTVQNMHLWLCIDILTLWNTLRVKVR